VRFFFKSLLFSSYILSLICFCSDLLFLLLRQEPSDPPSPLLSPPLFPDPRRFPAFLSRLDLLVGPPTRLLPSPAFVQSLFPFPPFFVFRSEMFLACFPSLVLHLSPLPDPPKNPAFGDFIFPSFAPNPYFWSLVSESLLTGMPKQPTKYPA